MQNTLSTIFSSFFKYLIITSILFVWLSDIFNNAYITITISLILSIIIDILYNLATRKRKNTLQLSKDERKEIEDISKQFLFADRKNILNFFNSMFSQTYKSEIKNNYITITKDNKKIILSPIFNCTELNNENIISAYHICKSEGITEAIILTNRFSDENTKLINMVSDVKITIYDIESVYKNIICKYNNPPNFDIELSKVKALKFRDVTNHAFNKKLAKNYFLSGILLLFASVFTKFRLYYTIMSTLLLIFSLICIFKNDKKNKYVKNNTIL